MEPLPTLVEYWHWLVFGVLLLALEVFAPGAILMWFGFGALITGAVLWLIPDMGMGWQLLLFSLLSVASLILWHKSSLGREDSVPSPDPTLNNRLRSHIGRQYVLSSAIINGNGAIRVDDSYWRVTGPDLPAGTRVTITGVNGITFTVSEAETS